LSTDGHGETSIPPYNFVVGGIKKYKRIEEHIRDLLDAFTTINIQI
jgi:hypothetical protein